MKKIDVAQMELGYLAMANINLTIAQEDFHLETEGMKYYEMDSKNSEGDTEAK